MTTIIKKGLDQPLESKQDLLRYLLAGARTQDDWGIGVEVESLALVEATGEAAPYARIEALLQSLLVTGSWEPILEQGHLIGLKGPESQITLEPGAQVELSGRFCHDLHCSHADLMNNFNPVLEAARRQGLLFLGLGVQPFSRLDEIPWVPKSRYDVMGPYMLRCGDMGQRMMKQTAGLQVNFDFSDEADCLQKLRIAQWLSPLLYALFANSPLLEGAPSGYLSTRGEIWSRTDSQRSGIIPALFDPAANMETYVDYALDVPMYFIHRDGNYLDMTAEPFSFRRYMEQGFAGQSPILADWDMHLSTLFTEVRLRPQIEIRTPDCLPAHLTFAVAALLKGLLYDDQARAEICARFESLSIEDFMSLYRASWTQGLGTPMQGQTLRGFAREALSLARAGLGRQHARFGRGADESHYLSDVDELVEGGVTLSERLLGRWSGSVEQKIDVLRQHCALVPQH